MVSYFFTKKIFKQILIFSLFIKIFICFLIGDNYLVEEWKVLVFNLKNYSTYSYYNINDQIIPSAYMPPLYAFILFVFSLVGLNEFFLVKTILTLQSIISTCSVSIFFSISKKYFNEKISLTLSYIFLFYPLNFYAATQISSISLQVFLFCFFLLFFLNFEKKNNYIFYGLVSGFMMLLRGEFYLLFFLTIIIIYLRKNSVSKILISIFISSLILSPYMYRNYVTFDKFVITQSSGYNLWRGNNIFSDINGTAHDEKIYPNLIYQKDLILNKLIKNKQLNKYEIFIDDFYKKKALENIRREPEKYLKLYIQKFFAYLIFNYSSNYPNYYNVLSVIPEIVVSLLFICGLIINLISKKKNIEVLILLLFYLLIIPIFFILPRYKLFILPILLLYVGYLLNINYLSRIFSNKQ